MQGWGHTSDKTVFDALCLVRARAEAVLIITTYDLVAGPIRARVLREMVTMPCDDERAGQRDHTKPHDRPFQIQICIHCQARRIIRRGAA